MHRTGWQFEDILPENAKSYDKMRPPKKDGQATTVFFHVTVMGLDSIDETSMVWIFCWLGDVREWRSSLNFLIKFRLHCLKL